MEIATILVPLDFSPRSDRALEKACELARHFDAELVLLHVTTPPLGATAVMMGPGSADPVTHARIDEAVHWAAEASLGARREDLVRKGLRCEARVLVGSAADTIVQMAAELPAELIVMGTRGRTGLAHVLLGSTAERTLRLAPCPVLVVKDPHASGDGRV